MRLKNIVLTKLIHDRLVSYEELEREMNSTNDSETQSENIMGFLKKITNLDNMIKLWEGVIKDDIKIMEDMTKKGKHG